VQNGESPENGAHACAYIIYNVNVKYEYYPGYCQSVYNCKSQGGGGYDDFPAVCIVQPGMNCQTAPFDEFVHN
jgi:hypothetical protein